MTSRALLPLAVLGMALAPAETRADGPPASKPAGAKEMTVHLVQANNNSPYAFVRARFEPGEVADPWAVRFFDGKEKEVPYFVWDAITWKVARQGRPDWGSRYALVPSSGKAEPADDSACAALYLLRFTVPPLGKERLTLRIYDATQVKPRRQTWQGERAEKRIAVKQGDLAFSRLPDQLAVSWKGKELFRYAGFKAGGAAGNQAHADPARPFQLRVEEGIVSKVVLRGKTPGRNKGQMDWQCTYWLFPEGGYAALEGFSLTDAKDYAGGEQRLSILESAKGFRPVHTPTWDAPWWVHETAEDGFAATHLFHHVPLAVGYGRNPFSVNPEGGDKNPAAEVDGKRLALRWLHPEKGWEPKVDWLYRQYLVGLGGKSPDAQASLRQVLGAAAGWLDRPFTEGEIAASVLQPHLQRRAEFPEAWRGVLDITLPHVLQPDPVGARAALEQALDPASLTDTHIKHMTTHVAAGGNPVTGATHNDKKEIIGEGWIDNPAYHACQMPSAVRFLEHFELPHPDERYQKSLLRYADFSLEYLGGKPLDFKKLRSAYHSHWPNRFVMIIPLMLHAYTLTKDEKYARAATMLFDDLMALAERNPHGYWPAWTFRPGAAVYDTVYNPGGIERGIVAFWAEGLLELIGRERASRFANAQARWFVFSGQLLDTLEAENKMALRAGGHHAHPLFRAQLPLYLYDDFPFYRGLVGHLPRGQGLGSGTEQRYGAYLIRWALGIGHGTRWFEKQVQVLPEKKGFHLHLRNGKPWTRPAVWLYSDEVGAEGPRQPVVWLSLPKPTWARPATVEVAPQEKALRLRVSHRVHLRLYYPALRPKWKNAGKLTLSHQPAGSSRRQPVMEAQWQGDSVEWEACAGEYELRWTEH